MLCSWTREEAYLYVDAVRTLMAYMDTKITDTAANKVLQGDAQRARLSIGVRHRSVRHLALDVWS